MQHGTGMQKQREAGDSKRGRVRIRPDLQLGRRGGFAEEKKSGGFAEKENTI